MLIETLDDQIIRAQTPQRSSVARAGDSSKSRQAFTGRSPANDDGSGVFGSGAASQSDRQSVAGFAPRVGLLACAVCIRFRRCEARGVWRRLWKNLQADPFAKARGVLMDSTTVRAHQHAAGAPKNGPDQALGRSRGGLSTKIHAATIDENCAVALHLTPGQAHDGRQFESLYESLDPDNVLESAALDRGYDADRIRERLALDGLQAVIPSIPARSQKLPCDLELYRGLNRIDRFFNKLKEFRLIATRYDKLPKTFCAAVHLAAAFLIIRNS